ncbi:NAD-dependent epimerase/dehydratase family protein [Streptomyces sp. NPDC051561]|uniref:NAD-dependent epimerase/dehydratase family protein n=1 Tax=Streptomyces sp. NPDC051561 TaxID=3365658 RepID=UPI0037972CE7
MTQTGGGGTSRGSALVIGATGQIGRAAVRALAADGWEVRAGSRGGGRDASWPEEVHGVRVDREDDASLAAAVGDGVDVLVDIVAFTEAHARQLTALSDRIGSAVVISSVAVYADDEGRSFDTQERPDGFPRFPVPMPETQVTVAAGDETYGTRKVAIEQALLGAEDLPTTLLRAGAVHGPGCRTPRELYFVKRVLDGRPVRVLAYGGESRFHPVHVENLAELIRLAAAKPGDRVLNGADPEAPTVAEIGAAIDRTMGAGSELVTLEGPPPKSKVGETPWSAGHPVVCDMGAAERELGYRPVVGYEESLPATVEWLVGQLKESGWEEAFPKMAARGDIFDYAAEDAWLAARGA